MTDSLQKSTVYGDANREFETTVPGAMTIWLEDGIIRVGEISPSLVSLEDARRSRDFMIDIQTKTACKVLLVDFGDKLMHLSPEVRRYFAGEETSAFFDRIALIAPNPVARVVASFFMGINKPVSPTRVFGSVDSAVGWLKERSKP